MLLASNTRAWNVLILVVKFIYCHSRKDLLTLFWICWTLCIFYRFPCQCSADLRVMLNTARMGFYHTLCFSHPLWVSLCPRQWQQFLFYSLNHFREEDKLFTLKSVKFWAWFFSLWYRPGRVWLKVFLCGFLQYVRGEMSEACVKWLRH